MNSSNTQKKSFLDNPIFNTKVKSANVKWKEMLFGYLIGPIGGLVTSQIFAVYLNTYWTDVLGLGENYSLFLSMFPLISIIFIAIGNFVVGQIIERTKTRHGKARPYFFPAAVLIAGATVLLYAVPSGNQVLQLVWIAVAYNLYYAVAYPLYSAANSLMIPLSTRNGKQRSSLSVISNLAGTAATFFATTLMSLPFLVPVFNNKQGPWLIFMCVISVLSLVLISLQYYYTRERITEENIKLNIKAEKIPVKKQLKALVTNKYWLIVMIYYFIFQFVGTMQNSTVVYFCNYVLGTYNDGYTQTVLNLVSGIPMMIGMFFVWPLANKFGKKNCMLVGLLLAAAGCGIGMIGPTSWALVLAGMCLRSLAVSPAIYLVFALIADVLDNIEAKNGFRCDGMSVAVMSIVMSVLGSLSIGIFNAITGATGYVKPVEDAAGNIVAAVQNAATQNAIVWCYLGFMLVGYIICAVLLVFVRVEKNIDEDHETIIAHQRQAVLEAGGEWIEPAERLRLEEEEADRLAEEARIAELKAYCEKKGLNFQKEEAKYIQRRELKAQKKAAKEKKKRENAK